MICAIAELESDRQPIATRYNKKTKETTIGIMQILAKTADWLVRYCMVSDLKSDCVTSCWAVFSPSQCLRNEVQVRNFLAVRQVTGNTKWKGIQNFCTGPL